MGEFSRSETVGLPGNLDCKDGTKILLRQRREEARRGAGNRGYGWQVAIKKVWLSLTTRGASTEENNVWIFAVVLTGPG